VLAERLGALRAILPGEGHAVQRLGEPFNALLAAFSSGRKRRQPRPRRFPSSWAPSRPGQGRRNRSRPG
jgi:hypothetical protein